MNNVFIYVEGNDDKRFIENILLKKFNSTLNIVIIPYQQKKNKTVINHIKMIASKGYNLIFLTDLDSHSYPCISSRRDKRLKEYSSLNLNDIVVVKEEIEGWFLAGIEDSMDIFKEFNVDNSTENITKEDLDQMIEKSQFKSKIDFMNEVSKYYNIELAMERNSSFKYFINKLNSFI